MGQVVCSFTRAVLSRKSHTRCTGTRRHVRAAPRNRPEPYRRTNLGSNAPRYSPSAHKLLSINLSDVLISRAERDNYSQRRFVNLVFNIDVKIRLACHSPPLLSQHVFHAAARSTGINAFL